MSGRRGGRDRAGWADGPEPVEASGPPPAPVLQPVRRQRPPGQRLYDMPYSAVAPRLINPALGLHNLVARAGHNAAYEIDVTLLDAPDHRLIRSGVLLAHRVLDGRGEWYLTAPDWQPLLPKDRIELMGHADLPEELADLIRPLRRRAHLGPVAALRCERREFALRDGQGTTVALLRDDKVTVRRGGLTTARYREVMLTPVGPGLNEDQTNWLERALLSAGSTQVARFPRLVSRLGAPANGPSDVPEPDPFDPAAPFKRFVSQLLGLRLRRMVEADLAVRGGEVRATERLVEQARHLLVELQGLAVATPADWVDDLADGLDWLLAEPNLPQAALARRPPDQLSARLRSERYVALLDLLVGAARAPRLGEWGSQPAAEAGVALLNRVVERIGAAVESVTRDEDDPAAWAEVYAAVSLVDAVTALIGHVLPAGAAELGARLAKPRRLLTRAHTREVGAEEAIAQVSHLTAEQAFAAGREYERRAEETRLARAAFIRSWAKAHKKLVSPRSALQQRPVPSSDG